MADEIIYYCKNYKATLHIQNFVDSRPSHPYVIFEDPIPD